MDPFNFYLINTEKVGGDFAQDYSSFFPSASKFFYKTRDGKELVSIFLRFYTARHKSSVTLEPMAWSDRFNGGDQKETGIDSFFLSLESEGKDVDSYLQHLSSVPRNLTVTNSDIAFFCDFCVQKRVMTKREIDKNLNGFLYLLRARYSFFAKDYLKARHMVGLGVETCGWSESKKILGGSPIFYLYPDPYARLISEASALFQVKDSLIRAVMDVESGLNPSRISSRDARGLMQILPATAMDFCKKSEKELFVPRDNILCGVGYLGWLQKKYQGRLQAVLAAYNAGTGRVEQWGGAQEDNFYQNIQYEETRRYVLKVQEKEKNYDLLYTVREK